MKAVSSEQLWERLAAEGLVNEVNAPPADLQSPWFVRVMLGFAGWLGALFLLGFVYASLEFVFRSSTASMIIGASLCAAAALIFRAWRGKDFAVQFGLAVSFSGQALFIVGLMELFKWGSGVGYLAITVFEAILVAFIINTMNRVVCAFAAAVSLSFVLSSIDIPHLAPSLIAAGFAVLWLNELAWSARGSLVRPVGYGLVLAAMYLNGALLLHGAVWLGGSAHSDPGLVMLSYWAGVILNGAVLLYVVWRLLGRDGRQVDDRLTPVALIAALATALSSFMAPGMITGLVIALVGYANGNRVLTGLGIFALIAYLSHYYYQLETTLLIKAATLVATGMVLLVARFVLAGVWPHKAEGGNSHA